MSWWPWLVGWWAQAWDHLPPPLPSPPLPTPAHPNSSRPRACLLERVCYLGGLMPSRYNSATLPYTSRSREHIYPVCAVKLLAPAIFLWSLMSIPLVFQEDGLGEVGQQRLMLKWGWGWDSGHRTTLIHTWSSSASCSAHDDTLSESAKVDVSKSVQWSVYPIQYKKTVINSRQQTLHLSISFLFWIQNWQILQWFCAFILCLLTSRTHNLFAVLHAHSFICERG